MYLFINLDVFDSFRKVARVKRDLLMSLYYSLFHSFFGLYAMLQNKIKSCSLLSVRLKNLERLTPFFV